MARFIHKGGKWVNAETGMEEEPSAKWDWSTPSTLHISKDYEGYTCPITGKWIEGRAAHQENLKRHGCRLIEKGEKEQTHRERERELDRACRETARELTRMIAERHF